MSTSMSISVALDCNRSQLVTARQETYSYLHYTDADPQITHLHLPLLGW
jgi:hypothetical protein